MKDDFFEGADFGNGVFKALTPEYYPEKYKRYIKEETEIIKSRVKGSDNVLEAGVGTGRLIPEIAPLVKKFVGVDKSELMLDKSKKIAENYNNVKIINADLRKLGKYFPKDYFDCTLCLWNTLGNVDEDEKTLREISGVTRKRVFITVYLKGTLKYRKEWCRTVGVKVEKIDEKNEIFYYSGGQISKSYSIDDLEELAKRVDLKVREHRILSGVTIFAELCK